MVEVFHSGEVYNVIIICGASEVDLLCGTRC